MRALLLHCKNYNVKIDELATRPENILPEEVNETEQSCKDCIVVLVTVEKDDSIELYIPNCLNNS